MEIIGTCIDCWPASASLTVNAFCAIAMLGLAVYRSAETQEIAADNPRAAFCFFAPGILFSIIDGNSTDDIYIK